MITKDIVSYFVVYRVKLGVTYHFVYSVKVCANQRHYALFVYRAEIGVNQRCVLFVCLELGKTLCPICLFTELDLVLTTDINFVLFIFLQSEATSLVEINVIKPVQYSGKWVFNLTDNNRIPVLDIAMPLCLTI